MILILRMDLFTAVPDDIVVEVLSRCPLDELLIITLGKILDIAVVFRVDNEYAVIVVSKRKRYLLHKYQYE